MANEGSDQLSLIGGCVEGKLFWGLGANGRRKSFRNAWL
jgi:hypothetical protein